jgi:hypothetical protein
LAERLYREARPFLVSLSKQHSQCSPDGLVRDALANGQWAEAVSDMLRSGWRPNGATRDEIRRILVDGRTDGESVSVDEALRLSV